MNYIIIGPACVEDVSIPITFCARSVSCEQPGTNHHEDHTGTRAGRDWNWRHHHNQHNAALVQQGTLMVGTLLRDAAGRSTPSPDTCVPWSRPLPGQALGSSAGRLWRGVSYAQEHEAPRTMCIQIPRRSHFRVQAPVRFSTIALIKLYVINVLLFKKK